MRIADIGEPLACPSGTAGELATPTHRNADDFRIHLERTKR